MQIITLAIVENDAVLTKVLRAYFSQQPDIRLVFVSACVEELLAELEESLLPQVLLLDIGLPGLSGTQALPLLHARYPALEVIMHTAREEVEHIYQALCCGATGYLTKGTPLDQLGAGVREVARGGAPLSRLVSRKVLGHFRPTPATHQALLTPREQQVLQGIIDGLSDKEISTRLDLSTLTIRTHVKHVYRKMHVNSRTQLLNQHLRGNLQPQAPHSMA
ncbi:response regulator transcription factor [Hymenobacter sp. BT683]|uniref:Response regulator transcription factor n=1 Tax=Hymenobacter jeongseonensis TaxID=2791027 RepID=A0ABS0INU4_9BACT|nr:response regulator transcription factor [Hymenobacter jeongseonensis]MBF9239862.1 response regulator transcription factor [Hymenobacter jeongseonensis]